MKDDWSAQSPKVADLFPGPFVHVGFDEVQTEQWAGDPAIRAALIARGMTVEDYQTWCFSFVQKVLAGRGKRVLAWEEAYYGPVAKLRPPPGAVSQAWAKERFAAAGLNVGLPTIMTPAHFLYLDHLQKIEDHEPGLHWAGIISLERIPKIFLTRS